MMREEDLTIVRILSMRLSFTLLFRYIDNIYKNGSLMEKYQNIFPGTVQTNRRRI